LEGLEITEITTRELGSDNSSLRFDSEFFNKKYLVLQKSLANLNTEKLDKVSAWITQGPNPIFVESGIPCLTGRNISNGRVVYLDADSISDDWNIKHFITSFRSTGRLDAEYYQRKYEEYSKLIKSYTNGWEPIQECCVIYDRSFIPDKNKNYKYIELANIGSTGGIQHVQSYLGNELPSRAKRQVFTNNVLISSIEGSLESCALVTEEYNRNICSTGFHILSSNRINSETLMLLFKSKIIQCLLKQRCSGTILTAINKDELCKIPIPLIDNISQNKIASLVTESFHLRRQSDYLLEIAKKTVEIAIEVSEDSALRFIKENTVLD